MSCYVCFNWLLLKGYISWVYRKGIFRVFWFLFGLKVGKGKFGYLFLFGDLVKVVERGDFCLEWDVVLLVFLGLFSSCWVKKLVLKVFGVV